MYIKGEAILRFTDGTSQTVRTTARHTRVPEAIEDLSDQLNVVRVREEKAGRQWTTVTAYVERMVT